MLKPGTTAECDMPQMPENFLRLHVSARDLPSSQDPCTLILRHGMSDWHVLPIGFLKAAAAPFGRDASPADTPGSAASSCCKQAWSFEVMG